jgi:hypothetical protein
MKIEDCITAISENADRVATICEADLSRRVVYSTRAGIMVDAIRGVFLAMDQIERDGAASDFNDQWRSLRSRLALSQSRFEAVISVAANITQPACRPVAGNSRNWT